MKISNKRFLGILIKDNFPLWLAPVQARDIDESNEKRARRILQKYACVFL
ncbi:hypothetical protein [Fibrobacter sp. UWEL]|nr:hypothetical protein [Fibrobacter sp. UWEL]SHL49239.1 hypothetical protein SAMN05720468_1347 [Fibrobacter sp. UWEL]